MRHGTTVWNEKGITQGRTNNRLSSAGKELTETVADKTKDIKFDIIYSSPLMRTMQTANIINKYHNVKIIKDNRLIEIDQGIFTGRSKDDITEEEKKLKFARSEKCGMESYQRAYDRTKDFVAELIQTCKFDTVLIITHNVNASFVEDILKGVIVDFENANHVRSFNNAEMKCFDIE